MFVNAFGIPITQSAPHIYVSALPFTPTKSLISQQYLNHFPQTFRVTTGALQSWPVLCHVLQGHTGSVNGVSLSPDGRYIASAASDMSIRVWSLETGVLVSGPLNHDTLVHSLAFSFDGKYIASGLHDGTIIVWDTESNTVFSGPFKVHTDFTISVAYTPDNMSIISSSSQGVVSISADTGVVSWTKSDEQIYRLPCDGKQDATSVSYVTTW